MRTILIVSILFGITYSSLASDAEHFQELVQGYERLACSCSSSISERCANVFINLAHMYYRIDTNDRIGYSRTADKCKDVIRRFSQFRKAEATGY